MSSGGGGPLEHFQFPTMAPSDTSPSTAPSSPLTSCPVSPVFTASTSLSSKPSSHSGNTSILQLGNQKRSYYKGRPKLRIPSSPPPFPRVITLGSPVSSDNEENQMDESERILDSDEIPSSWTRRSGSPCDATTRQNRKRKRKRIIVSEEAELEPEAKEGEVEMNVGSQVWRMTPESLDSTSTCEYNGKGLTVDNIPGEDVLEGQRDNTLELKLAKDDRLSPARLKLSNDQVQDLRLAGENAFSGVETLTSNKDSVKAMQEPEAQRLLREVASQSPTYPGPNDGHDEETFPERKEQASSPANEDGALRAKAQLDEPKSGVDGEQLSHDPPPVGQRVEPKRSPSPTQVTSTSATWTEEILGAVECTTATIPPAVMPEVNPRPDTANFGDSYVNDPVNLSQSAQSLLTKVSLKGKEDRTANIDLSASRSIASPSFSPRPPNIRARLVPGETISWPMLRIYLIPALHPLLRRKLTRFLILKGAVVIPYPEQADVVIGIPPKPNFAGTLGDNSPLILSYAWLFHCLYTDTVQVDPNSLVFVKNPEKEDEDETEDETEPTDVPKRERCSPMLVAIGGDKGTELVKTFTRLIESNGGVVVPPSQCEYYIVHQSQPDCEALRKLGCRSGTKLHTGRWIHQMLALDSLPTSSSPNRKRAIIVERKKSQEKCYVDIPPSSESGSALVSCPVKIEVGSPQEIPRRIKEQVVEGRSSIVPVTFPLPHEGLPPLTPLVELPQHPSDKWAGARRSALVSPSPTPELPSPQSLPEPPKRPFSPGTKAFLDSLINITPPKSQLVSTPLSPTRPNSAPSYATQPAVPI